MHIVKKLYGTLRSVANHPLHRRSKFKAITQFCVAQVAVRLVPGDVCVPFPNRTKLLVSPRMKGAAHFIFPGLCEFEEMSFVMHYLRPEDLFIDIGANVGAYTVLASGVAGARTIAFEPNAHTFEYLLQNVRLNGLEGKATPLNLALGSEEGVLQLTEGLGTENYICLNEDSLPKIEVKVATLDKSLEGLNPTLLKIDVEGFETKVLAGGQRTLAKPSLNALIIERTGVAQRYGFDESALHRHIQARGFLPCAYSPLDRSLVRIPDDALGNIIYVKDLESVGKKLKGGQPFQFANTSI